MKRRLGKTTLAAAMLAIVPTLSNAQTAIGSSFNLGVYADANQLDSNFQSDTYANSQGATLNPFAVSLSVTDSVAGGHHVTTTSAASATWASAGQGTVLWRGMGWSHVSNSQTAAKLNGFVTGAPVWSYTFLATANGTFTMNYDVRSSGDPFGLLGVVVEWSGVGGGQDLSNAFTPVAHGVFSRSLTAGSTYTIGLSNMGNIFTSADPRNDFGSMDADFNWTTSTVPEPASFCVVALGGFALLRRRK